MLLKKKPKAEKIVKTTFPHKIVNIASKSIMFIDFGHLSNASFNNSMCRKVVFKLFSYNENDNVDELVLEKHFKRVFNNEQVRMIRELSKVIRGIGKDTLCIDCKKNLENAWEDPLGYYYSLHNKPCRKCSEELNKIRKRLVTTKFIRRAVKIGDAHRAYSALLKPILIPEIVSAYIEVTKPQEQIKKKYNIGDVNVSIYSLTHRPDNFYFIDLPELRLTNDELNIINKIFEDLCKLKIEIDYDPESIRREFKKIIHDLLDKYEKKKEVKEKLFEILFRHTAGYGTIEPLLVDERIQDVYVDSGSSLVHIVHSEFGECLTNILMTKDELDKLTTRLRSISGRPLDASSPVLHAEIEEYGIRVCGIMPPSTYKGTGFAFRRRKSEPWTLAEFAYVGMLDHETAGLLSFLVDGQTSILVVGPRSSGKTSLLTSLLLEIPQNMRIILIEDTPEIPVNSLRKLGFKIEHLKTEAFAKGFELSAEDALRTSLRLGESVLVIGEVRGKEARALFEAMRVGAAGNVVLGTIHGSGPYDTWDRVVNDLNVPSTSFKAVDIIITTGAIRKGDNVKRHKRLLGVTEIGKMWKDDPLKQMKDLITYNRKSDKWKTKIKESLTIRKIAEVKGLSVSKVKQNIETRSKIKRDLIKAANKKPELISAKWIVVANNKYFELAAKNDNYNEVYKQWNEWFKKVIK